MRFPVGEIIVVFEAREERGLRRGREEGGREEFFTCVRMVY